MDFMIRWKELSDHRRKIARASSSPWPKIANREDTSESGGAEVFANTDKRPLVSFRQRGGETIAEIQLGAMALALAERLEDLASPAGPIFIHGNHIGIEQRQPGPAAGSPSQPSSTPDPATLRRPGRDNGPIPLQ